jgi:hypothetical protein
MLKGPQRCATCPQKRTDYKDYMLGFYWPTGTPDDHDCNLTERRITEDVNNGTFNRFCPLWINTEWPTT